MVLDNGIEAFSWLVTADDPLRPPYWQQSGWKLHAVEVDPKDSCESVRFIPAACGLYARHGWDIDLLIPEKPGYFCTRCVAALDRKGYIIDTKKYLYQGPVMPTPAQRKALLHVAATSGATRRPTWVRRDVWMRLHDAEWLCQTGGGGSGDPSELTNSGRVVIGATHQVAVSTQPCTKDK